MAHLCFLDYARPHIIISYARDNHVISLRIVPFTYFSMIHMGFYGVARTLLISPLLRSFLHICNLLEF